MTLACGSILLMKEQNVKDVDHHLDIFVEKDAKNLNNKYCSGKHRCQICKKIYNCDGVPFGHDDKQKGFRCHGPYEQFCENHTIKEYIKKHIELGDISAEQLNKRL